MRLYAPPAATAADDCHSSTTSMVMNILPALFSSMVVPPLSCTACRSMTLPRAVAAAKVCHDAVALSGGRKDDSRSSPADLSSGLHLPHVFDTRSRRATNSGLDLTALP